MRKNNHLVMAVAACVVCVGHAMAQSVPAIATVGDLASIQSETLLGKAKLVKAQVYADLRKFSGDSEGGAGALAGQVDLSLPQLTRIVEANGVSEATLAYANGKIDAREGDRVPGGYVVLKIRPEISTVQLKARNGHVVDVPVSSLSGLSATPGAPTQQNPTSMMPMPFPPNPMMAGAPQPQQPTPANIPRLGPSFAGPGTSGAH
jgi:type IV pilus biogenesis protein PilP